MKVQRGIGNWGLGVGRWLLLICSWPLAIGFEVSHSNCVPPAGVFACASGEGNARREVAGLYVRERFIAGAKVVIFPICGLRLDIGCWELGICASMFSVLRSPF